MDELSAKRLASVLFESVETPGGSEFPHIAGYYIHRLIGRGGGGDVYEGAVVSTARPVAIKLLRPQYATNAKSALRELDRLTSVRSNVVPHVLDYGWYQDKIYIVTEFIDGVNPREYCRTRNLKETVRVLIRIADAVSVLHTRGMLHRDIKPSNILITKDGEPVLLDLGIASFLTEIESEDNGHVQGTRRYMSPEQAAGINKESSTSWDVYALGVLSLELLIDHRVDPQCSDMDKQLNQLPRGLQAIIRKSIAQSTADRYETAQQLRDDLSSWLKKEPTIASKTRLWSRFMSFFATRPVVTASAIGLLIIISSVLASIGLVAWRGTKAFRFESIRNANGESILTLFALNGNVLHQWRMNVGNRVRPNNRLIKVHDRDIAVIGLGAPDYNSGYEGLMVYETGKWDAPVWVAEQTVTPEMAHVTRFEKPPHRFHYMNHFYFDIYPEYIGDEVLSIHRHNPSSLCAVQIHSLDGELLSEYYHDGWLESAAWLPEQRQVVLVGQNSDGTWEDRGASELPAGKYPLVIFAITPELGSVRNTVRYPGLGVGIAPDWYQCLAPPDGYVPFADGMGGPYHSVNLSPKPREAEQGHVYWRLGIAGRAENDKGQLGLEIDADGELVRTWVSDTWNKPDTQNIPPEAYELIDLPQRITPREYIPLQPPGFDS